MNRAIGLNEAEHYHWGENCDGWFFVKSPELSVIRERMPPGTSEARHYHERAWQFFFVLAGELLIEVEGKRFMLTTDQGMEIAPGSTHHVQNTSNGDTLFLVISRPSSHGDRITAPGVD